MTDHESSDEEDGSDWEMISNPKILHRSSSTPNLDQGEVIEEEEEEDKEEADSGTSEYENVDSVATTITEMDRSMVLVPASDARNPAPETSEPMIKRVPSFKDALLLNASETKQQEDDLESRQKQEEERARVETLARRRGRMSKTRFIVSPIKRCAKSTGDLAGLVRIQEDAETEESGVFGDTDANEFYCRKEHGVVSWRNGMKKRPDEMKRREMIIYKKDVQRRNCK